MTATRARFQYSQLDNTTIKSKAMKAIKSELGKISFNITEDNVLDHPIAYTFMYVQWEANEVISDELIRNLSLTFATIAVVSLLLVANIQVKSSQCSVANNFNFNFKTYLATLSKHLMTESLGI